MSTLTLTLKETPAQRLDMSPFTPQRLAGMTPGEIARIPLWQGNCKVETGELFALTGRPDHWLTIRSDSDRLDNIGADLEEGSIRVEGHAGAYLGRGMKNGSISVEGNSGPFTGSAMEGGRIDIAGDAGDFLGAGIAGERQGMKGGMITVAGNAGDRAGDQLRRGSILVRGDAGDYCGSRMIAGTLLILGQVGHQAGIYMRRGTLLLRQEPSSLPVTFNENGTLNLSFLVLLQQDLKQQQIPFPVEISPRTRRWLGDLGCGGQGEILVQDG